MKVEWARPGVITHSGQGEDGELYQIVWFIKEVSVGPALTGPEGLLSGEYGVLKNGERIGVYESLAKALEAVEQLG